MGKGGGMVFKRRKRFSSEKTHDMDLQELASTMVAFIDGWVVERIQVSQKGVECCAISTYSCIAFQSFVLSATQQGGKKKAGMEDLDLGILVRNKKFFEDNIMRGSMIWSVVVQMRRFSAHETTLSMMKKELKKLIAAAREEEKNILAPPVLYKMTSDHRIIPSSTVYSQSTPSRWTSLLYEILSTRYASMCDGSDESTVHDSSSLPKNMWETRVLHSIAKRPGVPKKNVGLFLSVDEIFKNSPGLCCLDTSEVLYSYHLQMTLMDPVVLQYDINVMSARLVDAMGLKLRTRKYKDVTFLLHNYKNVYLIDASTDVIVDLMTLLYIAECCLLQEDTSKATTTTTTTLSPHVALATTQPGGKKTLDPTHTYSAVEFIESLLSSQKQGGGEEQPVAAGHESMRSFIFTANGSSVSVFCDVHRGNFALFDSHPNHMAESNVYYTQTKSGFYSLIHHFFAKRMASSMDPVYIDIIEVCLSAEDFLMIGEKTKPFQEINHIKTLCGSNGKMTK
jgi:hypothetical protein